MKQSKVHISIYCQRKERWTGVEAKHDWFWFLDNKVSSLFQALSLSVWTIEKAGGWRAGSDRERGGALFFSLPDPARSWSRLSPVRFTIVLTDREPGTGYMKKSLINSRLCAQKTHDTTSQFTTRLECVLHFVERSKTCDEHLSTWVGHVDFRWNRELTLKCKFKC